jgi:hypothetical protein
MQLLFIAIEINYSFINVAELPSEVSWVQEGTVIEAIIVWRVGLRKVGRRHNGHLVTIDRVAHKEKLDLVRNLVKLRIYFVCTKFTLKLKSLSNLSGSQLV